MGKFLFCFGVFCRGGVEWMGLNSSQTVSLERIFDPEKAHLNLNFRRYDN